MLQLLMSCTMSVSVKCSSVYCLMASVCSRMRQQHSCPYVLLRLLCLACVHLMKLCQLPLWLGQHACLTCE